MKKYNPVTGKVEEKKSQTNYPRCLGFHQSLKDISKIKSPNTGDFAICFETQTTHKFSGEEWIDE